MRAVAQVVAVARVTAAVLQRVGADRNRERLLGGLAGKHARDVDLERNRRDVTVESGTNAEGAAAAGRREIGFGQLALGEHRVKPTKEENHEDGEEHEGKKNPSCLRLRALRALRGSQL